MANTRHQLILRALKELDTLTDTLDEAAEADGPNDLNPTRIRETHALAEHLEDRLRLLAIWDEPESGEHLDRNAGSIFGDVEGAKKRLAEKKAKRKVAKR